MAITSLIPTCYPVDDVYVLVILSDAEKRRRSRRRAARTCLGFGTGRYLHLPRDSSQSPIAPLPTPGSRLGLGMCNCKHMYMSRLRGSGESARETFLLHPVKFFSRLLDKIAKEACTWDRNSGLFVYFIRRLRISNGENRMVNFLSC